jgi:hypothetical protein
MPRIGSIYLSTFIRDMCIPAEGIMGSIRGVAVAAVVVILLVAFTAAQEPKASDAVRQIGSIGISEQWGAGWIELRPTDFRAGDILRLRVGGTAQRILVRLLARSQDPDSPVGILDDAISVPASRIVEVRLRRDYPGTVQISVHGRANPWGLYELGASNGPANLLSVDLIRAK